MEHITELASKLRLNLTQLAAITEEFQRNFKAEDSLWLFGSRADLSSRGGDIDLYIETNILDIDKAVAAKSAFVTALYRRIGEQKIDVVLNILDAKYEPLEIYKLAKTTGVQII